MKHRKLGDASSTELAALGSGAVRCERDGFESFAGRSGSALNPDLQTISGEPRIASRRHRPVVRRTIGKQGATVLDRRSLRTDTRSDAIRSAEAGSAAALAGPADVHGGSLGPISCWIG